MKPVFEQRLIEHCAPTLCGLKAANLFRLNDVDLESMRRAAAKWDQALSARGIRVRILWACRERSACLVYVYRHRWLDRLLHKPDTQSFLAQAGYGMTETGEMIRELCRRLKAQSGFPHEIGIFLGYPLTDVKGFIDNRGENYTFSGYWKSYGDPEAARTSSEACMHCLRSCAERYNRGASLMEIIAAA